MHHNDMIRNCLPWRNIQVHFQTVALDKHSGALGLRGRQRGRSVGVLTGGITVEGSGRRGEVLEFVFELNELSRMVVNSRVGVCRSSCRSSLWKCCSSSGLTTSATSTFMSTLVSSSTTNSGGAQKLRIEPACLHSVVGTVTVRALRS